MLEAITIKQWWLSFFYPTINVVYLGLAEKVRNVADIRRGARRCINNTSIDLQRHRWYISG
jgi:hypothetical protein